ncbi:MAG: DNA-3-methyladenine glycosylase 2 family protein [Planctomycetes bacterium]|nr:DNA-3-methyladenine glycosylase 2 family protein [Planctomycetota bacterium]
MPPAFDPQHATDHLSAVDRRLAKLIERVGPFTLKPQRLHNPFQSLLRAIVYQQLSGKAAATIHERLSNIVSNERGPHPELIMAAPDAQLRGAGLSRNKLLAIRDLSTKTLDGTVPSLVAMRKMTDQEIVDRLVQVRGIGPWTVEMMLIFRLGRPDVLPAHDLGVRKGFMLTYGLKELPAPMELKQRGERWRPYRSVASWYMWRACEVYQKKEQPAVNPLVNGAKKTKRG